MGKGTSAKFVPAVAAEPVPIIVAHEEGIGVAETDGRAVGVVLCALEMLAVVPQADMLIRVKNTMDNQIGDRD